MGKQLQIRIFPDGRVHAETKNMKGKTCLKYIKTVEEILQARTVDSQFTKEYYEVEESQQYTDNVEVVKNGK